MLVVHAATIVLQPVAHDEIIHVQQHVVDRNLVEHSLGELNRWSFILNDHPRMQVGVVKNTVCPHALVTNLELHFIGKQRVGIALLLNQKMDEMLPDPFFGRECHMFSAQNIEYCGMLASAGKIYLKCGEI